jgi:putative xylitol transport system ATP-binding protein
VAKSFNGVPALRNGCLELHAGSVHALCGGNGAGKSTFLNVLMGILQRDAGSIKVRGREVHFANPNEALHARISIITQELSPIPGMTVAENIFLGREPKKLVSSSITRACSHGPASCWSACVSISTRARRCTD